MLQKCSSFGHQALLSRQTRKRTGRFQMQISWLWTLGLQPPPPPLGHPASRPPRGDEARDGTSPADGEWAERASLPISHVGPALRREPGRAAAAAPPGWAPVPGAAPTPGPGKGTAGRGGAVGVGEGCGPCPQRQVVAGVPSDWARGNALPGDCVHAPLTQASRCRAAADHAWPREPIGRRLTHLCR